MNAVKYVFGHLNSGKTTLLSPVHLWASWSEASCRSFCVVDVADVHRCWSTPPINVVQRLCRHLQNRTSEIACDIFFKIMFFFKSILPTKWIYWGHQCSWTLSHPSKQHAGLVQEVRGGLESKSGANISWSVASPVLHMVKQLTKIFWHLTCSFLLSSRVTRRLDYISNFSHLQQWKFTQ